eukprot:GILK01002325.1.p1 GENE.GILK01002325.1~~GILK01002325.1.p1  ORF type:complete len:514 (-),score=114.81 GILK01002325.1:111-1652(-)
MARGVVLLCLCLVFVLLPYKVAASCKDASLSCSECLSRTSHGRIRDITCSYCTEAVNIDDEMHHCFAKPDDHCHTGLIVKASNTIATNTAKISELCANPVEMKQQVAVMQNLAEEAAEQDKHLKTAKPTVIQIHIHNNAVIPRYTTDDGLTDLTTFNWNSIPFYKLLIPNQNPISYELEADAMRYYEPIFDMFRHYMPRFVNRQQDIATVLHNELDDLTGTPFDFNDLQKAVVETLQMIDKLYSNKIERLTARVRDSKQFAREQAILFAVESALDIAIKHTQDARESLLRSSLLRLDSALNDPSLVQEAMEQAERLDEADRKFILKYSNMLYVYHKAVERLDRVEKEFVRRVTNPYLSDLREIQKEQGAPTGSPVSRYLKRFLTDPRDIEDEATQLANLDRDRRVTQVLVELETLLATVVQFKYFLNPHSLETKQIADWLKMFAALPVYGGFTAVQFVLNELFESIRREVIYWKLKDNSDLTAFSHLFVAQPETSMIPQPKTEKGLLDRIRRR